MEWVVTALVGLGVFCLLLLAWCNGLANRVKHLEQNAEFLNQQVAALNNKANDKWSRNQLMR